MSLISSNSEASPHPEWTWRIGVVVESPEIVADLDAALAEAGATKSFELSPSASSFDVAQAVDRNRPDLIFVELARVPRSAAEWIQEVRRNDVPLVVAVHPSAEPAEMISALRAGASEFLSLPLRPAIFEAMERIAVLLESRRNATLESGATFGVLSAKGGCGATSIACYLGAALQRAEPQARVLIADLDHQSPGVPGVFRAAPQSDAAAALESVRRLSSNSWREFVTPVSPGLDLLASPADPVAGNTSELPEAWRVESLFRFIVRNYRWIFLDLGRHLNPSNWTLLQHVDELLIVTAPDVLALFQTRSIIQTLNSRGFEKSRLRLILNRNQISPADFWVESIQQMFEMPVFGVIPNDEAAFDKSARNRFDFPADTPFGKAITRIAAKMAKAAPHTSARAA